MKYIFAAASLSLVAGQAIRRPLNMIQRSHILRPQTLAETEASTTIDVSDSFTETLALYTYNTTADSLTSYYDLTLQIDVDATLNKEKFTGSVTY